LTAYAGKKKLAGKERRIKPWAVRKDEYRSLIMVSKSSKEILAESELESSAIACMVRTQRGEEKASSCWRRT